MKRIFKYFFTLLLIIVAAAACRDEDLERRPSMDDNIGAVTKVTRNPARTFFNLLNPLQDEFVEFTIDVDGFNVTKINSVDVELVFTEKDRVYDPFQDEYVDSVYAPVIVKTITTFPAVVQITGQEVANALGIASVDDFEVGDAFNVTFPINTADGRRLTVALNSELCNQPGQPSFGGCNVAWAVTCPSEIPEGEWEVYVASSNTTYTVNLTSDGGGNYSLDNFNLDYDVSFYDSFNNLPLSAAFSDICNTIILNGTADFGVTWRGQGTYDAATQTITFPSISDPAYGQGPYTNGGAGYVLTYVP
jgi:hypothetical protein